MADLKYRYDAARSYCASLGLKWDEGVLPNADAVFAKHALTQEAVDDLTRLYCWNMAWYWRPSNYTFRQRIAVALHFLLRRK